MTATITLYDDHYSRPWCPWQRTPW